MTTLEACQWIRETRLSLALGESTWGVPILAAVHVLGVAWFGGAVLVPDSRLATFRRTGAALMIATGILLFWSQPVHNYESVWFRVKIALLALILGGSRFLPRNLLLALWALILAASRGIAFY